MQGESDACLSVEIARRIPIMPMIAKGGLYPYLQSVQRYLSPPIAGVFLLGLFWLQAISVVVVAVVSLLTAPPELSKIENLTYATATDAQRPKGV